MLDSAVELERSHSRIFGEPEPVTLRQTRGPDGQSVLVPAGDVLAVDDVLDRAAGYVWAAGNRGLSDELTETRAAVAELVEAAKFAQEVLAELGAPTRGQQQEMGARLRAALARIGGAP
jgi:hypothetical protein